MKLLIPLLLLCAGCSSLVRTDRIIKELAKDPASTAVSIQTIYGTVYIVRAQTNQTIIVGPITIKP